MILSALHVPSFITGKGQGICWSGKWSSPLVQHVYIASRYLPPEHSKTTMSSPPQASLRSEMGMLLPAESVINGGVDCIDGEKKTRMRRCAGICFVTESFYLPAWSQPRLSWNKLLGPTRYMSHAYPLCRNDNGIANPSLSNIVCLYVRESRTHIHVPRIHHTWMTQGHNSGLASKSTWSPSQWRPLVYCIYIYHIANHGQDKRWDFRPWLKRLSSLYVYVGLPGVERFACTIGWICAIVVIRP